MVDIPNKINFQKLKWISRHLFHMSAHYFSIFVNLFSNQKVMPKCYICRSLREWRTFFFFFFCQEEAEMQRQGERSLICFLFISGALWQTAELLFYAVRLCRLCQDSLKTTHFLFRNVCLMASVSEVSFESNFVACFSFIWNLAEEELWMKTPLVCVLFSVHRRDRIWIMTPWEIEYELIMTPWKSIPWWLKSWCALIYCIMILYILIVFRCLYL